jgi:hypothetical protein
MKYLSILVMMVITIAPTQLSFGQSATSTQAPQTTPNKTPSAASKHHKKPANDTKAATTNNAKTDKPDGANKPGGKGATLPSQDAAYALSGNKSAPEAAPRPKQ